MSDSKRLLDRIAEITRPVLDGEVGAIRCIVDEECSGIPANFSDAIWQAHDGAVGEEFHLLIRDFSHSFKKPDGTFPNVVNLHFHQAGLKAELWTELYDSTLDRIETRHWVTLDAPGHQK